ncbi:MAG: hypothetical protein HC934_10015 [Acaryochloridaceae cyanobacterium SU_2_1]|nr:hypothetical protein [Acaryochloridaceae cyanobacterium SU_2_1]
MPHPLPPPQLLITALALIVSASKIEAHTLKTTESIGVTFHLEPDHTPRAREAAQVWFALTEKGGRVIPLSQCDCQLRIYSESSLKSQDSLLQVPLQAISAQQYQNIPGATVTFPTSGLYRLELQGHPQAQAKFKPFNFSFLVTVLGDSSSPSSPASKPIPKPVTNQPTQSVAGIGHNPGLLLGAVLGMGGTVAALTLLVSKQLRK